MGDDHIKLSLLKKFDFVHIIVSIYLKIVYSLFFIEKVTCKFFYSYSLSRNK